MDTAEQHVGQRYGCFCKLGVLFGCLYEIRAQLFGVYVRTLLFGNSHIRHETQFMSKWFAAGATKKEAIILGEVKSLQFQHICEPVCSLNSSSPWRMMCTAATSGIKPDA